MTLAQQYIEPTRTEFSINEAKLRKFMELRSDPKIQFLPRSTKVVISVEEHISVEGMCDESVALSVEGVRGFGGIKFDLTNLQIINLKNETARPIFEAIMRHILGWLQDSLCVCGSVECHCNDK